MSGMECLGCTATTTNGLAMCGACLDTLSMACANVAAYYADVEKIQPGQGVRSRSTPRSTPPPGFEPERVDRISETLDHVVMIAVGWARNLLDDRPTVGAMPTTLRGVVGWLESHRVTIATLEWAGECLREMLDCERRLQRLLDRSDTGRFVGTCYADLGEDDEGPVTCDRALYASDSVTYVRCPQCGVQHEVAERRRQLAEATRDELAPVRTIARIVVGLLPEEPSEERLTRRIERWIDRGLLSDYGVRVLDGRPRRVYRIGDVLDRLNVDAVRKVG